MLFLRPLIHFNANSHHYYYRIRKIPRNHTGCCKQRSTCLLLLTTVCRERERGEAGAEMGIDPLKPHWVLFATLFFFTSTNREMKQEQQKES